MIFLLCVTSRKNANRNAAAQLKYRPTSGSVVQIYNFIHHHMVAKKIS